MDWNAIAIAGLLGAIGGVLGALLGRLIGLMLPEKARRIAFGVSVAIGVAVSVIAKPLLFPEVFSGGWYSRNVTAEQFDKEVERSSDPLDEILRIVRDNDPEFYAAVRDKAIALTRAGHPKEQIINLVRAQFTDQVAVRMPKLNDEELAQVLDIVVFQFTHYSNVAPKVCVNLMLNRPAGDIRQYMSDDMIQKEIKLNRIVFSSKLEGGATLTEEEVEALLKPIRASIIDLHGGEGSRVLMGSVSELDDRKICSVYLSFFNGIRDVPMPRRAQLWRTLAKAKGGG